MLKTIHNNYLYVGLISIVIIVSVFFILPGFFPVTFISGSENNISGIASTTESTSTVVIVKKVVKHEATPEAVKGIYMTACVASMPSFRAKLLKLVNETELNSIIIDIKDYTGTVAFSIDSPEFQGNKGGGCKVADMEDFIKTLHDNNIYVIGRITAFQDPQMTKAHPEWAVKTSSDKSVVWKDRKGLSFVDAGATPMWQYLVNLAKASYEIGFDEINFDYIRFPSDGNMKDIYFPWSSLIWAAEKNKAVIPVLVATTTTSSTTTTTTVIAPVVLSNKALVMKSFFEFLHKELKDTGMKLSVDFFGMTTTNTDDLNIGQVLETAIPYFDYISPMVYPSHYPVGFLGYKSVADVNAHPYEIVKYSMGAAVKRLITASSTPLKLRPWLQDNDYPVPYTPAMVRTQIQATYDVGLTSWMLWDAANTYTQSALKVD